MKNNPFSQWPLKHFDTLAIANVAQQSLNFKTTRFNNSATKLSNLSQQNNELYQSVLKHQIYNIVADSITTIGEIASTVGDDQIGLIESSSGVGVQMRVATIPNLRYYVIRLTKDEYNSKTKTFTDGKIEDLIPILIVGQSAVFQFYLTTVYAVVWFSKPQARESGKFAEGYNNALAKLKLSVNYDTIVVKNIKDNPVYNAEFIRIANDSYDQFSCTIVSTEVPYRMSISDITKMIGTIPSDKMIVIYPDNTLGTTLLGSSEFNLIKFLYQDREVSIGFPITMKQDTRDPIIARLKKDYGLVESTPELMKEKISASAYKTITSNEFSFKEPLALVSSIIRAHNSDLIKQ